MECPVCFELYDDTAHRPANLSCGHPVCEGCADRMSGNESGQSATMIECPHCRNHSTVMGVNYGMLNVIQAAKEEAKSLASTQPIQPLRKSEPVLSNEEARRLRQQTETSLIAMKQYRDSDNVNVMLNERRAVFDEQLKSIDKAVNEMIDSLKRAADQRRVQLLQMLRGYVTNETNRVHAVLTDEKSRQHQTQQILEQCQQLLSSNTPYSLREAHRLAHMWKPEPPSIAPLQIQCQTSPDVLESISKFGSFVASGIDIKACTLTGKGMTAAIVQIPVTMVLMLVAVPADDDSAPDFNAIAPLIDIIDVNTEERVPCQTRPAQHQPSRSQHTLLIEYTPSAVGHVRIVVSVEGFMIPGVPCEVPVRQPIAWDRVQLQHPNQIAQYASHGVCFLPNGNIMASNATQHMVHIYDRTHGTILLSFGRHGSGQGQFDHPTGVAASNSVLWVADTLNHRIQAFNHHGEFLSQWGKRGQAGGQFNHPVHLTYTPAGVLAVTDQNNHRIQLFNREGQILRSIGRHGNGLGEFNQPTSTIYSNDGKMIVCDMDRIQIMEPDGTPITSLRVPRAHTMQLAHEGTRILVCAQDLVLVSFATGEIVRHWPLDRSPTDVAVSEDGCLVLCSGRGIQTWRV